MMNSATDRTRRLAVVLGLMIAAVGGRAAAQTRNPADTLHTGEMFVRKDAMIPMRDGAQLYTEIYVPRQASKALPFLMERTPYDARSGLTGFRPTPTGYSTRLYDHQELAREGYIFVFQDIRGRFRSTGQYVSLRPPRDRSQPGSVDESTDTYDTIDWLVKNVPGNNGRVGVLGISYGGYTSMRAMLEPHPALKATSPQASCADMFVGDDWHHNGAFRLDYSFRWLAAMERGKGRNTWDFSNTDAYQWFLDLGPLSAVNERLFQGRVPSWNKFVEHPNYDAYWETENCGVLPFIKDVPVPTLTVAGWFDAEDFYGPLAIYRKAERFDTRRWNYLVIGPWTHGGWTIYDDGRKILDIDFGSNTARFFRERIQNVWFAHWLKDQGTLRMPEVQAFQTGSNVWESFDAWPPRNVTTERKLYLRADHTLSFAPPPAAAGAFDQYVSDPDNPVPYRAQPIKGGEGWPEWQLQDQRPLVKGRPDVVSWVSEPLREDLTVTGDIVAHLFASTTGTDSDWIVKLIDVFPEPEPTNPRLSGYQMMVAGEVFRGRFWKDFRKPVALVPNEVTPYTISLRDRDHRFLEGHRIMVQVQSSWFPLIDRNPQTFVPNIYEARSTEFVKATQRIYRSRDQASHLVLPVRTR
jgi:putative CocE/NonD family hydrolase